MEKGYSGKEKQWNSDIVNGLYFTYGNFAGLMERGNGMPETGKWELIGYQVVG